MRDKKERTKMFCRDCGKRIAEGAAFCSGCGAKLVSGFSQGLKKSSNLLGNSRDIVSLHQSAMTEDASRILQRNRTSSIAPPTWSPKTERMMAMETTNPSLGTISKQNSGKKAAIISIVAVFLALTVLLAFVFLDGALIQTGGHSYRYFGTLSELLLEDSSVLGRIYHEELTITCSDYEIKEVGGMDDSISNTTHYASGLTEPTDRFMSVEMLVTRKSDGWRFYFEDYRDVSKWMMKNEILSSMRKPNQGYSRFKLCCAKNGQ